MAVLSEQSFIDVVQAELLSHVDLRTVPEEEARDMIERLITVVLASFMKNIEQRAGELKKKTAFKKIIEDEDQKALAAFISEHVPDAKERLHNEIVFLKKDLLHFAAANG